MDEELAKSPGAQGNGPEPQARADIRAKILKWENHEKEEKTMNDLLERRFHTDLKTARGGRGTTRITNSELEVVVGVG